MLKSKSEFHLSQEDMVQAVEFWLNEKVFKESVTVRHIKIDNSKGHGTKSIFIVVLFSPSEDLAPYDEGVKYKVYNNE